MNYYYELTPTLLSLYVYVTNMQFNCYSLVLFVLLLSSSSSPLCRLFTIMSLKQTMFIEYVMLQLFYSYNVW
jgi:hypothetical protein